MKRIEDYGSVMQRMHPSGNCFADAVQRAENGGRRSRISMRLGAGIAAAVVALCVGANVLLFYRMTHMPIGIVSPGVAAALPQVTVQDTADAGAMLNDFYMHLYDENVHDDSLNGKLPDYDWGKTALSISGEWDTEQVTVSARAVTGDMYTVIVLYDLTAKTENPSAGWYQQTDLPVVHAETAVHMSYSLPELDLNAVTRHTQQVDAQTVRVMAVYPMPDGDTLIGRDISLCMNGTGAMLSNHSLIIPFLQNCNRSETGDVPNFGGGELYRIALNSPVSLKLLTADGGRYGAKHLDRTVDQGCDMLTAAMKDGTEMLLVCDLICQADEGRG